MSHSNLHNLWHDTCERVWNAPASSVQATPNEVIAYPTEPLKSDTCVFNFCPITDLDYQSHASATKRFDRLVRDYLNLQSTLRFLSAARQITHNDVKPGASTALLCATRQTASFGNCILGFTYRGSRTTNPTITMHSRTTYITSTAALDLALASAVAKEVCHRTGLREKDIAFEWKLDSIQFHAYRSIPYLNNRGLFRDRPHPHKPAQVLVHGQRQRLANQGCSDSAPTAVKRVVAYLDRTMYNAHATCDCDGNVFVQHDISLDALTRQSSRAVSIVS